ncbi:hypothetical protein [Pandoraea aquatica]|nr:hypothetical protein [Pandoraea aquatica]
MLTDEQKLLIQQGLRKGVADTQIAKAIGVKHMAVFHYRKTLGISSDEVRDIRYDTWVRLLESGMDVERVAALYEVLPATVITTLQKQRDFSYAEAKKRARAALEEEFRRALGITAKDIKKQQRETWKTLADSGMSFEAIATLYEVSTDTVQKALRRKAPGKFSSQADGSAFDW